MLVKMDENGDFGKGQCNSFLSRVGEREPKPRGATNEASALTARQSDARVLSLVSFQNSRHIKFCKQNTAMLIVLREN